MNLPPDLLPILLRLTCILYLAINLTHTLLQIRYAALHARHRSLEPPSGAAASWPSVDVIVPCFNEDPKLLDVCLTSIAGQDYPGRLRVFVVDDRSTNRANLLTVLRDHEWRPGWRVLLLPDWMGKRRAVDAALGLGDGDVVVTVDSDTVLLPDGIRHLVTSFADERVAAASANLRALNADANVLTRLINLQYWLLFEQERAAQGFHRAVLCCWGGFTAYRRAAMEFVWDRHLNQTVAGAPCTTGDDLHLTLELLSCGYDTVAEPHARALTQVPSTALDYARQQLRWSRSFVRELPRAVRAIVGRPAYLALDLATRLVTPLLLLTVMSLYALEWLVLGPVWLAGDLVLVVATLLGRSTIGALQARAPSYLLYGVVDLGLVLPGWLRAAVSPGRDAWGTRDRPAR